jgi:hypothetical protein
MRLLIARAAAARRISHDGDSLIRRGTEKVGPRSGKHILRVPFRGP